MNRLFKLFDMETTKNEKLDQWFFNIRQMISDDIRENNIDVDLLTFALGIGRLTFIEKMVHRDEDGSFYLKALELAEQWGKPNETEKRVSASHNQMDN